MSEKQTTHELMYSAFSVGMTALKSNSTARETASNDQSKVNHFEHRISLLFNYFFFTLNIKCTFKC